MTDKTVAEKARVKRGATFATLNPVPGVVESLGLPDDVTFVDVAEADNLLVFVSTSAELDSVMAPAIRDLSTGSVLWVFFRKGSKAAGYDVNRDSVWALAENNGMRPLGLLSVDDTWSVFRLRAGE